MYLGVDVRLFFDNIYASYEALPNEAKIVLYILLVLIFIAAILLIILLEQRRLNNKIVDKQIEVKDNTEVLDFDINDIDETNEKTRNLKEITDKIQAVIDSRAIDLTRFEQDQEENSIISYNELRKSVGKPVEEEPTQEFSLSNLVRKIEVDDQIEKEEPYAAPMPVREEKFKASAFISPVFGIEDRNRTIIKEEPAPMKVQEETFKQTEYKEEEKFLNNLINFRKNLE